MIRRSIAVAILAGLCSAAGAGGVGDIVAKMPAKSPAEGTPLAAAIVKLGPTGLKELCGMITPPQNTGDAKARFALHGVALYVKRPGAETERAMVERALLDALASAGDADVKAFFIAQIQLAGSDTAAGPLGKLLGNERLCEPATRALLQIGTAGSVTQLRSALPGAKGSNLLTIVRALGKARDKASTRAILPYAAAEDAGLRHTAWFALANIGDASATAVLAKAADAKGNYERAMGTKYYLLLARRLTEAGDKAACAKICRQVLAARTKPTDGNARCAALRVLADAIGADALDEVLAALAGPNAYVRDAATAILPDMRGPGATAKLVARLKGSSSQVKAAIVRALGQWGDKDALPALLSAASDKDKGVRLAALDALVGLAPPQAAGVAASAMKTSDGEEISAARGALLRLKAKGLSGTVAGALAAASAAGKIALLEVLSARGATDQKQAVLALLDGNDAKVRLAAARAIGVLGGQGDIPRIVRRLQAAKDPNEQSTLRKITATLCRRTGAGAKPILAAISRAKGPQRAALLPVLAGIGGRDALPVVLEDIRSSNKDIQDAAVRALADWPDPPASRHLLALASTTKNRVHHVLAVRGYVRLICLPSKRTPADTAKMFAQVLAAVNRAEEKKLILAGLSKVRTVEAMKLAVGCMDDPAVLEEAAMAAVKIACPTKAGDKPLTGPAVRQALKKIIKVSKNKRTRNTAQRYVGK